MSIGKPRAPSDIDIVFDQAALRRADEVRRHDQDRVGARFFRGRGQLDRIGMRLRAGGRDDRHAAARGLHRQPHQLVALLDTERTRLGGGAVDYHSVRTFGYLAFDHPRVRIVIDRAVTKWRDQRRVRAAQEIFVERQHI